MKHDYNDVIRLFNALFKNEFDTILVAGGNEPIYLPKTDSFPFHQVVFANGFIQSAMHEISHWCIAGEQRRLLTDYGYWYEPDGRTASQQQQFENVEIKPQALEWIFCQAADLKFRISVDNLGGEPSPTQLEFKKQVVAQAKRYIKEGVNDRAMYFIQALNEFYNTLYPAETDFKLSQVI